MPTTKEPESETRTTRDGAVEAVLFAADRAITAGRIAEALEISADEGGARVVHDAIGRLNESYEATGRSFRIEKVAGGYRAVTTPEFADAIAAFQAGKAQRRLSRAALEALSIIAYRQPVTRAEIEAIRGVACGEVLRALLEKRLIAITGRAEEVGRPMLYGTTRRFLELFGVASVRDLPAPEGFKPRAKPSPAADPAQEAGEEDAALDATDPEANTDP
ncbi:MAG: SMC-Scp complex subunit ScpB [Phycisphaeraceae bacterium]|nr:SMC-Scp complex subunit ScpB [Phycisphaeraceae bacterium]